MKPMEKPAKGLTLIELMIVVSLLAILVALAAPSVNAFFENEKKRSPIESIASGLKEAQNHALKFNTPIKFTLTSNGWAVTDINDQGEDGKDKVIASFDWSNLRWSAFSVAGKGSKDALIFNGLGRLADNNPNAIDSVTTTGGSPEKGIYDWRVVVDGADGIRVCRPDLSPPDGPDEKPDPRVCP